MKKGFGCRDAGIIFWGGCCFRRWGVIWCVCIAFMCFPAVGVYGVTQEDGTRVSHLPRNEKL